MKIVIGLPPNYEQICAVFPAVRNTRGVCFAYGDTLFTPHGTGTIEYHLRVHEETHGRQQSAMGVQTWWNRYLSDPSFRLEQEVEAYHNQFMAMSRPDRERKIRVIAGDLCGPIYGELVSFKEAKRLIRTGLHA